LIAAPGLCSIPAALEAFPLPSWPAGPACPGAWRNRDNNKTSRATRGERKRTGSKARLSEREGRGNGGWSLGQSWLPSPKQLPRSEAAIQSRPPLDALHQLDYPREGSFVPGASSAELRAIEGHRVGTAFRTAPHRFRKYRLASHHGRMFSHGLEGEPALPPTNAMTPSAYPAGHLQLRRAGVGRSGSCSMAESGPHPGNRAAPLRPPAVGMHLVEFTGLRCAGAFQGEASKVDSCTIAPVSPAMQPEAAHGALLGGVTDPRIPPPGLRTTAHPASGGGTPHGPKQGRALRDSIQRGSPAHAIHSEGNHARAAYRRRLYSLFLAQATIFSNGAGTV